jgi:hypothetical protein
MNGTLNLGSLISEKVLEYFYATGVKPNDILVSPGIYRNLLELKASEQPESCSAAQYAALKEISTPLGQLGVVIDELLPDTKIVFVNYAVQ